jgi:adenine-specific DNA-methyltransferase
LPRTEELNKSYKNPDNDPRGPWTSVKLDAKSGSEPNLYEIIFPNGIKWKPSPGRYPAYTKENLLKLYHDKRIWFGESGKNVPRLKKFLSEVQQGLVPNTLLLPNEVGNTQKAKEDYKKVLRNKNFDNPKPLQLINFYQ